jgi:hypothetical protein
MSADSVESTFASFTIEEIQQDDPRLKEILEIPDEEKQSSFHVTIQLLPGSDQLEIEEMEGLRFWLHCRLTVEDFNSLEALGLHGKLKVTGFCYSGQEPCSSRTLIVAQRQIKEAVDLPQPNNCQVIYYQVGDEWRKFPPEAPVLKKRFRLSVDPANPLRTSLWAEAYFGSDAGGGGGAFTWESAG